MAVGDANPLVRWRRSIRRRAVLASSFRRNQNAFSQWQRLEMAKGFLALFCVLLPDMLGFYRTPALIFFPLFVCAIVYMALVIWDGLQASRRLDRRRFAKLEALGCPMPSLKDGLSSKVLWRASMRSTTVHDLLKDPSMLEEYEREQSARK